MPTPTIRPSLTAADTALLMRALEDLGASRDTDYDTLKATTDLSARLRTAGRVFGLDWLEDHP
jgi:hypothetical protein